MKANNIILINCGASLDLIDILQPPEDSIIYLIDSLRPLEVRNVYNGVQIKIIVLQNELGIEQKNVPEFEEIFDEEEEEVVEEEADADGEDEAECDDEKEEEDEGNGGDDEEENNGNLYSDEDENSTSSKNKNKPVKSKRKRFDPDFLEKRHKKREWEEKRLLNCLNYTGRLHYKIRGVFLIK
jgi:hypothetical protein